MSGKQNLSCGCVRGEYLCDTALQLWESINSIYKREGLSDNYYKAREEYESHFDK